MKRFILLLGLTLVVTACPELQDKTPADPLSPSEQKVRLETLAEDMVNTYPAREFDEFFDLSNDFVEKYFDNYYDWDEFYEYCEQKGEDMSVWEEDSWYDDGVEYSEITYEVLVRLSDLQGMLTLGEYSAECSDYDGLKVLFSLNGNDYEATLEFSGKKTTAYYTYEDEYDDGYYNEKYSHSVEVEVPEKIHLTITENGKTFAEVTVELTVSFSKSGVNPTRDCFFVKTTIKIDEHELILSKTGYDAATGKAMAGFTIKKNSETIISASLSGEVKMDVVTDEYDDVYAEVTVAKNAKVDIDLLGQVQIKGSCNNILTLVDYIDNFYEADNKSTAERALKNINNQLDLGMYYDGSSTKQADVVIDYYLEDDYYGDEWYEMEPIIEFLDGSRYAFYEFFNEEDFEDTIDLFIDWIERYEDML